VIKYPQDFWENVIQIIMWYITRLTVPNTPSRIQIYNRFFQLC
jgi:hypothetical protein